MKALTICQPYAHLIALGEKRVENRTWSTDYRGWLAIHAGKSRKFLDTDGQDERRYPDMAFGAIVVVCRLTECVSELGGISDLILKRPELLWLTTHEHVEGPWCWILEDVIRLTDPLSCRGERGLFELPTEVASSLRRFLSV